MSLDSVLVVQARELAKLAHSHQVRKGSGVPYYTHLEGVARILSSHGYTEDSTLAAAYLHDVFEDQQEFANELRATMPPGVVKVVEVLTEQKFDPDGRKRPKAARFAGYLASLMLDDASAKSAIPISCADKIHNTLSIVEDARAGRAPFMQFATRPGELLGQLRQLRVVYEPVVTNALLATFDAACSELTLTVERWLPGRAALLAAQAHLGQFDKGGHPYIWHPMRLAVAAKTDEERVVALLHDVIEDSPITLNDLEREGFGTEVLCAVDALTRRQGEDYAAFIERVARHRLATRVKLLDLRDNSDTSRLSEVTESAKERLVRYRTSIERLELELEKRSLYAILDAASRERVRTLATLSVFKGEHVTLAYRVNPKDFEPAWVPGGYPVGSDIAFRAIALHRSEDLEVLSVQVAGQATRPHDQGVLHLTLSRSERAHSRDANILVAHNEGVRVNLDLLGRVCWVDA